MNPVYDIKEGDIVLVPASEAPMIPRRVAAVRNIYGFRDFDVGDMKLYRFEGATQERISKAAYQFAQRQKPYPWKFVTRTQVDGGIKCWRVE